MPLEYYYKSVTTLILFLLLHSSMKLLHNLIIQFLPELPCHRVCDILIDILPGIIQPTGLIVGHS